MKKGTRQHPKFKALRAMLQVDEAYAVGVLESLWMTVEEFQDDGAIGRWSDLRIAAAIGWSGDARQLILCLEECEFLDRVDGADRLVVHDWLSHCSSHVWDRVKRRVRRAGADCPGWLRVMHDKARVERSRNQTRDDAGADDEPSVMAKSGRTPIDPAASGSGQTDPTSSGRVRKRPAVSGNVRLHPATSDPNPRPKTQDLNSPSPPAGEGGFVVIGKTSDGGVVLPAAPKPVLISPSIVGRLQAEFPELSVLDELVQYATNERWASDPPAESRVMDKVRSWLGKARARPEMRAKRAEAIKSAASPKSSSDAEAKAKEAARIARERLAAMAAGGAS